MERNLIERINNEIEEERRVEEEEIREIYTSRDINSIRKLNELKEKNPRACREVLSTIEPVKYFIVKAGNQQRKFYMSEFQAGTKNHINGENQLRIYLNLPLLIRLIENVFWFELLIKCLVRGKIPLYYPNGEKISVNIYKNFRKFELKRALNGEIQNLLSTRQNLNYIKSQLSPNILNLIKYYNQLNPQKPWELAHRSTSSYDIQRAVGIRNPIDNEKFGRDMILYARITLNMIISDSANSRLAYRALEFLEPPNTIEDLFNMDRRGETTRFNEEKYHVKLYFIQHPETIFETTSRESNTISPMAIQEKFEYTYMKRNIEIPNNISEISIELLQRALRIFE